MENKGNEKKPTPESILEEIKLKYPNSKTFMEEVVNASKNHYASSRKADVGSVIVKLASIRNTFYGHDGEVIDRYEEEGKSISTEQAKKLYKDAASFAFLVAAVYHGEATFVSQDGSLLDKPVEN